MDYNFFTTYRCNSRCRNCSIWKNKDSREQDNMLCRDDLDQFFKQVADQGFGGIGIAGGEPTIAPFTWMLIDAVPPSKNITITTNGLNHKKLVSILESREDKHRFLVQISIDGTGPINDWIRGIPGGFDNAVSLLNSLKAIKIKTLVSFTINRKNYHQVMDVYRLAREYGAQFSTRMAYCGGAYENQENRELFDFTDNELDELEKELVCLVNADLERPDHHPARLVFWDHIVSCHRYPNKQRQVACRAMDTGAVIDLYGEVFPNCPALMEKKIGNIRETSIDKILSGTRAQDVRRGIRAFECGGCWNDCQVVTNIDQSPSFLFREYNRIKMRRILETVSLPDRIDFSAGDVSFLLSGWHGREEDNGFGYRWTEPEFAFPVPQNTRDLTFFLCVPEPVVQSGGTQIKFLIKGMEPVIVPVETSAWQTLTVRLPKTTAGVQMCTAFVNGRFCPGENGQSPDHRILGMAIHSISFMSPDTRDILSNNR